MPYLPILATILLIAQEASTQSRTVITSVGHRNSDFPKISRGQILTLFVRGLASESPGLAPVPVRTYTSAGFELNGLRAKLTVPALPGLSWDIPILGIAGSSAGNPPADARGITVQIPLQIPDSVLTAGNILALRRPRITIYDNGIEGFATEFEWRQAVPNIVTECDFINPGGGCQPWMFRLDGTTLGNTEHSIAYLGEEFVVMASGLAIVPDTALADGQVFPDPPPAMRYPVYIAFGNFNVTPSSVPELSPEAWTRVEARPAPGQLGLFELRFRMPEKHPLGDVIPPSRCTQTYLYVSQGPASPLSQPGVFCLGPRP